VDTIVLTLAEQCSRSIPPDGTPDDSQDGGQGKSARKGGKGTGAAKRCERKSGIP
jgi:hypothetical protein